MAPSVGSRPCAFATNNFTRTGKMGSIVSNSLSSLWLRERSFVFLLFQRFNHFSWPWRIMCSSRKARTIFQGATQAFSPLSKESDQGPTCDWTITILLQSSSRVEHTFRSIWAWKDENCHSGLFSNAELLLDGMTTGLYWRGGGKEVNVVEGAWREEVYEEDTDREDRIDKETDANTWVKC